MNQTESLIRIDVEEELQRIIAQLDRLQDQVAAPNLLKNALNATARKVRKQIVKDAKGQYAIKDTGILKDEKQGAPKVLTATVASMSAAVRSRGPMQDIMAFMTRRNTKTTAAMLKVLNESQLTALEVDGRKAFETTFKSGHTAIVQRRGKERLPVKKLLAPAVPFLYGKSYEEAEMDYYAILQKHIQRQVERTLERRAA